MAKSKRQTANAVQTLIIRFVGKRREKEKFVVREAPTQRINGARVFELPPDDDQKKGFTHPDAELLLKLYPKDFKIKSPKGKKVNK